MRFRCPNCDHNIQIGDVPAFSTEQTEVLTCPSCQSKISFSAEPTQTHVPISGVQIGQFELREIIGEGAFGTVYKAWDKVLLRPVAVKMPRRDRVRTDAGKAFLREARAAANIQHPNIVQVYEVGQAEQGFYLVCELIEGITLSEWYKGRTVSWEMTAQLLVTICEAVQAAHDANVIHRDLKPGNVMMDLKGVPHVTDFGLARQQANEITVTHDGRIVGTPSYMSPEQARGTPEDITPLSDIWSLGVMLYELLVGQRPFQATDSNSVLYRILTDDPTPPRKIRPDLPVDLQTIVLKTLEKRGNDRYQSASALADDLKRLLEKRPILAKPAGPVRHVAKWIHRNPVLAAVSGLCTVLGIVAACLLLFPNLLLASENRLAVQLTCNLDGNPLPADQVVKWAAVPLDPDTRELQQDRIQRSEDQVFRGELAAGVYLIVVEAAGFGFHEVYRTVPDAPQTIVRLNAHQSAELLADSVVGLPEIQIRRTENVTATMSLIAGGEFQMGDEQKDRRAHDRSVEDFWIDPTEVTVGQYKSFRNLAEAFLEGPEEKPVVELTWYEAAAFAEFEGKRLLTEAEFEFAATNRGTTAFPWGDTAASNDNTWPYEAAGRPVSDKLLNAPVYGLHSNVAEWTDSLLLPYPGQPAWPSDLMKLANIPGTRVVRGGPVTLGPNARENNSWSETPKFRAAWSAETEDSEIGFRCGRSAKPRFLD